MSMRSEVFAGAWYGMEITLDEKLIEKNTEVFSRLESEMRNYVKRYGLDYIPQKNKIFIKGNEETEFAMALTMLAGTRSLIPFTDKFVFYDFTEDGLSNPMDARKSYREWIASLLNEQPIDGNRSENDMKRMNNKIYLTAALCTALLFSVGCGKVEKADDAVITESTTTVVTSIETPTPADEEPAITVKLEGEENADPDEKAETDSDTAPEEIADITDDRKSETKDTTIETEDSEIDDTTETAETTAEKATTTSKAVTSSATTTTKKATTTTKAVAQTTTTTKKAATTTTTTKKTTTTTTQATSTVEWTPLMRAYQHYIEATFDVIDDMDIYDKSKITNAELEMIRKDICDYGLSFNGKQVVTLRTGDGIKTIDFLKPLELTVDTTLYCYSQGTWVLGDAHLNCETGWIWIDRQNYEKMSDEQKYQAALSVRENCFQGMEDALYAWYWYLSPANGGTSSLEYAYQLTFNWGFIDNGAGFWFLNR